MSPSIPSNTPLEKFFTGITPNSWATATVPVVPNLIRPGEAGSVLMALYASINRFLNRSKSATPTSPVPLTATAFKFFDPMTAPIPPLAAALDS